MTVRKAKLSTTDFFSLSNDEMIICHVQCGECMGERQKVDYGPTTLSGVNTDCKDCNGYGYIEASVPGSVFVQSVAGKILNPLIRAIKADTTGSAKGILAELGDMIEKARVKEVVED